jgi:hypothetical protein
MASEGATDLSLLALMPTPLAELAPISSHALPFQRRV